MLDLHTHTQASDGELTAKDLWTRYSEKNMGLGISDHLFRDGLSTEHGICAYLSQLESLSVYRGYEIDLGHSRILPDNLEDRFQYRILSVHSIRFPDGTVYSLEPYFAYRADAIGSFRNPFSKDTAKRVLERLLAVYETDMRRRHIEILGHCTATPFHDVLTSDSFLEGWENALLSLCEKYQTALEISELWQGPGLRMVQKAVRRSIKLSCGSDCHHAETAAKFCYVTEIIQQAGLNCEEYFFKP